MKKGDTMRVFITGMHSFVGQALIKQCRKRGIRYEGVDLLDARQDNCRKADIRDPGIADLVPEGVDALIHLAAMSRDPDCKDRAYECFDTNVMGTLNLINAARKKNVKQFIFASTEWVYDSFREGENKDEESLIDIGRITSEYALSKLVSEANLRQKFSHGFCPATILRFGIIYGPREKNWSAVESLFNAVKTKDEVRVGSLRTGRRFIHVEDIVSGIIDSLGLEGFNIINIQGDRLITLADIIDTSKKILERSPAIIETSPEKFNIRNVSNKKAKALLHWEPRYSLQEGLRSLIGTETEANLK